MKKILLTILEIYNTPTVDDKQGSSTNEPAGIVTPDGGNLGEIICKCVVILAVIALIATIIFFIRKKK